MIHPKWITAVFAWFCQIHFLENISGKSFLAFSILSYQVIKGRGIAFRDTQGVYTKGSEVGYSLPTIEKTLALKPLQKLDLMFKNELMNRPKLRYEIALNLRDESSSPNRERSDVIAALLQPGADPINTELLKEQRKPRKRQGLRM